MIWVGMTLRNRVKREVLVSLVLRFWFTLALLMNRSHRVWSLDDTRPPRLRFLWWFSSRSLTNFPCQQQEYVLDSTDRDITEGD